MCIRVVGGGRSVGVGASASAWIDGGVVTAATVYV